MGKRYTPHVQLDPAEAVVAGSMQSWALTFTAGPEGILPGGGIRIAVDMRTGISRLQIDDPRGEGYVACSSTAPVELRRYAATVQHPLSADLAPTWNPQMPTNLYVVDVIVAGAGALPAGQDITVVIGDRAEGGPGALAPTLAGELRFWVLLNEGRGVSRADCVSEIRFASAKATGTLLGGQFVHTAGNPVVRILPGPATEMRATLPSRVEAGARTPLRVVRFDAQSNPVQGNLVPVAIDDGGISAGDGGLEVTRPDGGSADPFVRLRVVDPASGLETRSNPARLATRDSDEPNLFWGDIHGHTLFSDGSWADPDDYFCYAREMAGLDFCALTDHDFGLAFRGVGTWEAVQRCVRRHNLPGEFVTLLAYESTHCRAGDGKAGHKLVYFADESGRLVNTSPYYGPDRNEIHGRTVDDLFAGLEGSGALVSAHQNVNTDWGFTHPMQRLVELYSTWGCAEYPGCPGVIPGMGPQSCVQAALARGHQLGFVAGSDTHIGQPGNRGELDPASRTVTRPGGLTALFAPELTRTAVWDALMCRRTYATTGARIMLELTVNGRDMGHVFDAVPERITLRVTAVGTDSIESVAVIKTNRTVHEACPGGDHAIFEWEDPGPARGDFYYVRITQIDGHRAWSSPVWTTPAT